MTHLLVSQLRFARAEFLRGLEGLTAEEGLRRFEPMNSIGWTIATGWSLPRVAKPSPA
jgi:hypothetical protein